MEIFDTKGTIRVDGVLVAEENFSIDNINDLVIDSASENIVIPNLTVDVSTENVVIPNLNVESAKTPHTKILKKKCYICCF